MKIGTLGGGGADLIIPCKNGQHPSFVPCLFCEGKSVDRVYNYLRTYLIKLRYVYNFSHPFNLPGKDKAIPLQAWTGPEGSSRLRLPDFKTIGT